MVDDVQSVEKRRREARLRRQATTMGLVVRKSRARDPLRMDYGRYRIERVGSDYVVAGRFPYGFTLDLDAVEEILDGLLEDEEQKAMDREWRAAHGGSADYKVVHER